MKTYLKNIEAQPIENLESRLFRWESKKKAIIAECFVMAMMGLVVTIGFLYGFSYLSNSAFGIREIAYAVVITAGLMLPTPVISYLVNDWRPTQADVDVDVALRRSVGMDSTVVK